MPSEPSREDSFHDQIDKADAIIVHLQAELQAAREDIQEAATAIEGFGNRLADALTENNSLKQQLQAAREEIERLNGRVADLWLGKFPTDPVASLSSQLTTAQAEIERLKDSPEQRSPAES